MLRVVAHTSWGADKHTLKTTDL